MARASPSHGSPARRVACALLLAQAASAAAAVLYDLEVTNNGPVTTDARATLHSVVHAKNKGPSSTRGGTYHFNWIYGPLTLVEKSDHGANSTIVVTSPFPGIFPVSVQVVPAGCRFCPTLAQGLTVLQVSEFIVGNLSVIQAENNDVPEKLRSHPATATLILVSFVLRDPSHYFESASFVYNWDFADGTELTTDEPSVYHNCSTPGTCVVHLRVVAEWRKRRTKTPFSQPVVRKTGHFDAALELSDDGTRLILVLNSYRACAGPSSCSVAVWFLQDAVQSINIIGSTEVHVMENLNFSLHIQGSPPLSLCWLIKTECVSLEADQCPLVVTNATDYHLSHVFSAAGQYCLSVRVENGVNMLQSFQEIRVKAVGIHPAFFVLPCLTLLSVTLGLAVYVTLRSNPQQKDLVEVADFDFSPMANKTSSGSEWSCGQICCQMCLLGPPQEPCNTVREHHRLLHPWHKPVKMYTR